MKKVKQSILCLLLALATILSFAACGKKGSSTIGDGDLALDEDFKCTITVDGGGQWASFNSTASMEESESNPYPYNTLEKLIEEYETLHPNIDVQLANSSYNGSRDAILPMLSTKSAPDILYMVPTCLAEDCNKNYYAPLDDYLALPNRYSKAGEAGSEAWLDIFGGELLKAVNGHYYATTMDRGAMGIIYNKTFFTENNIPIPATYTEFLDTIEKIHAADASVTPYNANGGNTWLDITLEGQMFLGILDQIDVINPDGVADAEEVMRAFDKGIFSPDDARYQALMDVMSAKTKYSKNPQNVVLKNEFITGDIIMGEADGNTIAFLTENCDFEVGTFPFPLLDTEASSYAVEGKGIRRGSCGLTSCWFVTNHAFSSSDPDENRKKVNACADFLMFLTAKENNDRMVNDKKVSVPLSGAGYGKNDCLKSLMEVYQEDLKNPNMYKWSTFNPSGSLDKSYYDVFYNAYHNYVYGNTSASDKGNKQTFAAALKSGLDKTLRKMVTLNKWDKESW